MNSNKKLPHINPSGLGECVKHNLSPWFIKLKFQSKEPMEDRIWKEATKPLSMLQATIGNEFESHVYDIIEKYTNKHIDTWYEWGTDKNRKQLLKYITEMAGKDTDERPIMMTQVKLQDTIGEFKISGDADLILLYPSDEGVQIYVYDIKSSWEEKPYQQLQTAVYTKIISNKLNNVNINYNIKGGIIYRETDIKSLKSYKTAPTFDRESREGDIKRMLKSGGPFERAFKTDFEDLPLPSNKNIPYSEVTVLKGIENSDLSLIDVDSSERKVLKEHDIETLGDLASLYDVIENPKLYDHDQIEPREKYKITVEKLEENENISESIQVLSQKSQSILGELSPSNEYSFNKPWNSDLQGKGSFNLPEDDPPFKANNMSIERNSLIRVYLNVQYDHVRDVLVSITGKVDCNKYDDDLLSFGSIVNNINRDSKTWGDYEHKMIEESLSEMFNCIENIAKETNQKHDAPIHFYIYSQKEYDELYESIRKYDNQIDVASTMRYLLDKREGIDQKMVSIVEPELKDKKALKTVNTSLQNIVNYFYPNDNLIEVIDWNYNNLTDGEINLKNAFKQGMFDSKFSIKQNNDGAKVLNKRGKNTVDMDSFYDIVPRNGSQIPIEYLWACKEINILDKSWSDKKSQQITIENYRWVDRNKKDHQITLDMFRELSNKLSYCLYQIERSLSVKDTQMNKNNIIISKFKFTEYDNIDLNESCIDYLDLEAHNRKSEAFDIYKKPIKKRITDGESIPIKINSIDDSYGYMFKAKGKLLLDEFNFSEPIKIASSSEIRENKRCVATPLTKEDNMFKVENNKPNKIARSIKVTVNKYDPRNQTIEIHGYMPSSKSDNIYTTKRPRWTTDNNSYGSYIGENSMFILDPNPDSRTSEKAYKALTNIENNTIYNDIIDIKNNIKTVGEFDLEEKHINEYMSKYGSILEFEPTDKQKEFIYNNKEISVLQGPPGTGKTSGALSHTLLSRAFDYEMKNKRLCGLVSGLSNKSIDEVLDDVSELASKYKTIDSNYLENIRLIRLSYDNPKDTKEHVEYFNYQNKKDLFKLNQLLINTKQQNISEIDGHNEHVIIFSTPSMIEGLMGKIIHEDMGSEKAYELSFSIFDILAIDEASMMPLHQLFMTGAFVKDDNYQLLLSGDHRQLPPVQQYEWEEEYRRSIVKNVPYLSVLDYMRYLKGEKLPNIHDETPTQNGADIPITRLDETFRCHEIITKFLQETVYSKDNISYHSNKTYTIENIENIDKEGIEQILNPKYPLTLIVHDDRSSKKVNELESILLGYLTNKLPGNETNGIVTPHNAQKGKLNVVCDEETTIDTVERFQGGQRDIMFLSTTVSEPSQLIDEEEFLLSPNRLNVALSRMKKKLIIICPKSIFELIPSNTEIYDDSIIWKKLYANVVSYENKLWEGETKDIINNDVIESNNSLEVYGLE